MRHAVVFALFSLSAFVFTGCQTLSPVRDEKILLEGSIRFYQLFISSQDEPSCIFTPTCSHYAKDAIRKHGLAGIVQAADRLSRCNPLTALYSTVYNRKADGKLIDPVDSLDPLEAP